MGNIHLISPVPEIMLYSPAIWDYITALTLQDIHAKTTQDPQTRRWKTYIALTAVMGAILTVPAYFNAVDLFSQNVHELGVRQIADHNAALVSPTAQGGHTNWAQAAHQMGTVTFVCTSQPISSCLDYTQKWAEMVPIWIFSLLFIRCFAALSFWQWNSQMWKNASQFLKDLAIWDKMSNESEFSFSIFACQFKLFFFFCTPGLELCSVFFMVPGIIPNSHKCPHSNNNPWINLRCLQGGRRTLSTVH